MAKKRRRIIDADKLLRKLGFKASSDKVLAMQDEIRQGEAMAKLMNSLSLGRGSFFSRAIF